MSSRAKDIEHEKSSGNVFADLGLPNPEQALVKAKLVLQISKLIEERGLSQAQAARLLGIDQPKISALLRGQLGGFSSDRLFRFLNALDQDVEITVRAKPPKRAARVRVKMAGRSRRVA